MRVLASPLLRFASLSLASAARAQTHCHVSSAPFNRLATLACPAARHSANGLPAAFPAGFRGTSILASSASPPSPPANEAAARKRAKMAAAGDAAVSAGNGEQAGAARKRIGTHNGTFHCDEAMGCFLLRRTLKFRDADVVRTRDEKVRAAGRRSAAMPFSPLVLTRTLRPPRPLSPFPPRCARACRGSAGAGGAERVLADLDAVIDMGGVYDPLHRPLRPPPTLSPPPPLPLSPPSSSPFSPLTPSPSPCCVCAAQVLAELDAVIDVGGVYDAATDRYDHHQRGFTEVFGHGFCTKLSSAGLVYKVGYWGGGGRSCARGEEGGLILASAPLSAARDSCTSGTERRGGASLVLASPSSRPCSLISLAPSPPVPPLPALPAPLLSMWGEQHYGEEVVAGLMGLPQTHADVHKVYLAVYRSFMESLDAIDNGVNQFESEHPPRYVNNTHLSARVGRFNPDWLDDASPAAQDAAFQKAMALAGEEFVEACCHSFPLRGMLPFLPAERHAAIPSPFLEPATCARRSSLPNPLPLPSFSWFTPHPTPHTAPLHHPNTPLQAAVTYTARSWLAVLTRLKTATPTPVPQPLPQRPAPPPWQAVSYTARSWLPARSIVEESIAAAVAEHGTAEIITLKQFCPWKGHLSELEGELKLNPLPKYMLYEDDRAKQWRVQAISVAPGSFESRCPLPLDWRGLRDDELSERSGIPRGVFVHMSGFIGGNHTYEGALAMAKAGLPEGAAADAAKAAEAAAATVA
ncbi:unnamed protein product [Closterium sp. Naga37s-1]|nr:unnamed protein product [Closterium sp. Naga37s-1]